MTRPLKPPRYQSLPIPPASRAASAQLRGVLMLVLPSNQPQPDELIEFDNLLAALDLGVITRVGWDKLKAILARAITHAENRDGGNDVAGLKGYVRLLRKWEEAGQYDGRP